MRKDKIGAIFLVSMLALAGIGVSYAGLTDSISVYGVVNTATVDLEIESYSGTWIWKVWGPGVTNELIESHDPNYVPIEYPNYMLVSYAKGRPIETNDPEGYDAVLEFDNLFPCIDFMADVVFHYVGTIPCKVNDVDWDWTGQAVTLPDGTVVDDFIEWLMVNGHMTGGFYRCDEFGVLDDPLDEVVVGTQLHGCDYFKLVVTIHLPQENWLQGLAGTGYVDIGVIQWNDECQPEEPPVEIDVFEATWCDLEFVHLDGTRELVQLTGNSEVHVFFEGPKEGDCGDDDTDGLDEVQTELVALELTGHSPILGTVNVRLNSDYRSLGLIEETSNVNPDRLDIPPFETTNGTADSFFDVFVEIDLPDAVGEPLYNLRPIKWSGVIHHKPPARCEAVHDPGITLLELFNKDGYSTGIFLGASSYLPGPCTVEIDVFDTSRCEFELIHPIGPEFTKVTGFSRMHVFFEGPLDGDCDDDNGNGLDEVQTELVELELVGFSPSLGSDVIVRLNSDYRSMGMIEETSNNVPNRLDVPPFGSAATTAYSFFDVFVEIEFLGLGVILHNERPMRWMGIIQHKPPLCEDLYENLDVVELLDAAGNFAGYQ